MIPNYKVVYDTGHGEYTLNQDTDYTETVSSVITGNGSITVTGTGNFYGTLTAEYTVQPAEIPLAEITLGEFGTYNGSEQTQTVEAVKFNGVTLVEGRDYVVTGNTATDAGTYTLTITGIGNVTGTITKEWKIKPRPVTVTITNTSKIYGEADPALDFTVSEETFKSSLAGEIVRTHGENVGVYVINQNTLTNENNPNFDITFIGGKFTIEPNKSGIEGLTVDNVKSSDKENVEYVYNQLENAVKDLADEEKKTQNGTIFRAIVPQCSRGLKSLQTVLQATKKKQQNTILIRLPPMMPTHWKALTMKSVSSILNTVII